MRAASALRRTPQHRLPAPRERRDGSAERGGASTLAPRRTTRLIAAVQGTLSVRVATTGSAHPGSPLPGLQPICLCQTKPPCPAKITGTLLPLNPRPIPPSFPLKFKPPTTYSPPAIFSSPPMNESETPAGGFAPPPKLPRPPNLGPFLGPRFIRLGHLFDRFFPPLFPDLFLHPFPNSPFPFPLPFPLRSGLPNTSLTVSARLPPAASLCRAIPGRGSPSSRCRN